jgi:hypothetical protein
MFSASFSRVHFMGRYFMNPHIDPDDNIDLLRRARAVAAFSIRTFWMGRFVPAASWVLFDSAGAAIYSCPASPVPESNAEVDRNFA